MSYNKKILSKYNAVYLSIQNDSIFTDITITFKKMFFIEKINIEDVTTPHILCTDMYGGRYTPLCNLYILSIKNHHKLIELKKNISDHNNLLKGSPEYLIFESHGHKILNCFDSLEKYYKRVDTRCDQGIFKYIEIKHNMEFDIDEDNRIKSSIDNGLIRLLMNNRYL